jgi:hypothetical protein
MWLLYYIYIYIYIYTILRSLVNQLLRESFLIFIHFTALRREFQLLPPQCLSGIQTLWKQCHTFEARILKQNGPWVFSVLANKWLVCGIPVIPKPRSAGRNSQVLHPAILQAMQQAKLFQPIHLTPVNFFRCLQMTTVPVNTCYVFTRLKHAWPIPRNESCLKSVATLSGHFNSTNRVSKVWQHIRGILIRNRLCANKRWISGRSRVQWTKMMEKVSEQLVHVVKNILSCFLHTNV